MNTFFITMPYLNIFIAMMVPDHWCYVPGQNLTNLTNEEWKNFTIPLKYNISGKATYSTCTMYNITNVDLKAVENIETVDCQYGWDYNRNWYKQTIPTQENWVCKNELRVTNTLTFLKIGELCGGILSGLFTDTLGRKPTFYVAILAMTIGRLCAVITHSYYPLFLLAAVISGIATTSMYQSALIIGMEITSPETRAHISVLQQVAWSAGVCILPGVMWITGDWITFVLLTTLPGLIHFLITARNMIESPRWLLNRGKLDASVKELQKIAKINKTQLPVNIHKLLDALPKNTEQSMGFLSLFIHWRIAKNTACSAFCTVAYQVIYYIIIINIGNIGGNPLLNFFLQSIVEVPGYIVSKIFADSFGRRWTHVAGFMISALCCFPLIALINDPNYEWLETAVSVLLKFTLAFAFYAINLQCYELYPTCLRQTGLSFCIISANIVILTVPYAVHLGRSVDVRIPYVMLSSFAFLAAVCGSMLPETLHHYLPDTIADAQIFGKDQSFWSLPKRRQEFELVET